jgi:hypothetical protein
MEAPGLLPLRPDRAGSREEVDPDCPSVGRYRVANSSGSPDILIGESGVDRHQKRLPSECTVGGDGAGSFALPGTANGVRHAKYVGLV